MPGETGPGSPSPKSTQGSQEIRVSTPMPGSRETSVPLETLHTSLPHMGDRPLVPGLAEAGLARAAALGQEAMEIHPVQQKSGGVPEYLIARHHSPGDPQGGWRDRLRGLRGSGRRVSREGNAQTQERQRPEVRRRESTPSFQQLNQERAQIVGRMDAAGNLSPEDQIRINEIFQQMDNLVLEARNLANFTVEGNLLDPNVRLRNLQEAQLRQQDLPPRYHGALVQYIDLETRERFSRSGSEFQQTIQNINRLERIVNPSAQEQQELQTEILRRNEILRDANALGFFDTVKDGVYGLLRESRIDVPRSQKKRMREGLVRALQQADRDPYETDRFWQNPDRADLRARYEGVIDYFHRESLSLSIAHLDNPRSQNLPDNGLNQIWNFQWKDERDIDPDARRTVNTFDELRQSIEQERHERPRYIGSPGNYLLPVEFIADDIPELVEAVEDLIIRLEKDGLSGSLEKIARELQEKQGYGDKAMESFKREASLESDHPVIMMLTTRMNSVATLLSAVVFEGLEGEGLKNYLEYMKVWGRGFVTVDIDGKKSNDHYLDAIVYDNEGWVLLASEELAFNEGEYWRYGSRGKVMTRSTPGNPHKPPTEGQRKRYQEQRDAEIVELLATHELRPIDELLDSHPAFQRFKSRLNNDQWEAYKKEAQAWESFVKRETLDDKRDPKAPIKFEHPLARILNPQELRLMYRQVEKLPEESDEKFNQRMEQRRKKAQTVLMRTKRLSSALLIDSTATSARIQLKDANGNYIGEVTTYEELVNQEVMKIVEKDKQKPLGERRFKVFHVLSELGLVDFPAYGAHMVGSEDTVREQVVQYFLDKPELKAIIDAQTIAPNAKTTIFRWMEDEKRVIDLVKRTVRLQKRIPTKDSQGREVYADGRDYYNYPGYGTPGGGVKGIKNRILYPNYGISRDTVRRGVNYHIQFANFGVRALLPEYGDRTLRSFMGWFKRNDELVLFEEGPVFDNTRGIGQWIGRVETALEEDAGLTGKGGRDKKPGIMRDGPLSGSHKIRTINKTANNFEGAEIISAVSHPFTDKTKPGDRGAFDKLLEGARNNYYVTAMEVLAPFVSYLKTRQGLENIYGGAAETARFLNTLDFYDLLNWMDYVPEEYRDQFGFSIDAMLPLARLHYDIGLWEGDGGLIFKAKDWRKIIVDEGLYDLLPPYLTEQITIGREGYKVNPIPRDNSSLNRRLYPANLDLRHESEDTIHNYGDADLLGDSKPLKPQGH